MPVTLVASEGVGTTWAPTGGSGIWQRNPASHFGAQAGDLLVFAAMIQQKQVIHTPAGWTAVAVVGPVVNSAAGLYFRLLDSTSAASDQTFDFSTGAGTGADHSVWWALFRGVNQADPVVQPAAQFSAGDPPPSRTFNKAGAALVEWVATGSNDAAALDESGPVNDGVRAFISNPVQWEANAAAYYRLNVGGYGPAVSTGIILTTPGGSPDVPSSTGLRLSWQRWVLSMLIQP